MLVRLVTIDVAVRFDAAAVRQRPAGVDGNGSGLTSSSCPLDLRGEPSVQPPSILSA